MLSPRTLTSANDYLGLCLVTGSSTVCDATKKIQETVTSSTSLESLALKLTGGDTSSTNSTTSNLVDIGVEFQQNINPPVIVAAGLIFLFAIVFRILLIHTDHSEAKNKWTRLINLYRCMLILLALSNCLVFAAAVASTETAAGMQWAFSTADAGIEAVQGKTIVGVQWACAALQVILSCMVSADALKLWGNVAGE